MPTFACPEERQRRPASRRLARSLLLLGLLAGALGAQPPHGDSIPLPEHPRPDFQRSAWQNLNGRWQFAFDPDNSGERAGWSDGRLPAAHTILVPFSWGA